MFHSLWRRKIKNEACNFKLSHEMSLADKKKFSYLKDLKLEITVGQCRGNNSIIIFFYSPEFYDKHIRLLTKNF